MIGYLIAGVALIGSLIGSWTDIKTREVSNWVSFGLIFALLGLRVVEGFVIGSFDTFLVCLGVGGAFFVMGLVLFYSQQWGGADLKLITAFGIGFGVLPLGFLPLNIGPWPFFLTLLMNFFIITVVYSVAYAVKKALNEPKVMKDFKKSMHKHEPIIGLALILISIVIGMYYTWLSWMVFIPLLWFMSRFLKAVEKNCMYREVTVNQLVEFDIPEVAIKVGKKVIAGTKDPNGMTLEQIAEIKKLVKAGKLPRKFNVKWGVPLIPVFPITLVVTLWYGDVLLAFLKLLTA
ncbi:MAG: prepilin peptidase [archaeon]